MLKKSAILIIAALLLAAPAAFAQAGHDGRWWNRPMVSEKLSLTDAEKAGLDQIFAQSERKRIDLKAAVAKQRFELSQVMENEGSDEKQITEQFAILRKAQNELANERFRFLLDVRKTLGADRFRTLTGMFEEFRSNRKARFMENMHGKRGQAAQEPDEQEGN